MFGGIYFGESYPAGFPSTASVTYTDAPTGTLTLTGSITDAKVYVEAPTGTLTGSGSDTDALAVQSSVTGTQTASGSVVDVHAYLDARSGTGTLSGNATDAATYADTATGTATLSGSTAETHGEVFTDTATGTQTLTGSATDAYLIAVVYTDAPIGTITISGSTTDQKVYGDVVAGTIGGGTIVVGPSGQVIVGSNVNQQSERPKHYRPQQQPPQYVILRSAHDQPSGTVNLTGTLDEDSAESYVYAAPRMIGDPTIEDVLNAQRHAQRQITRIREKVGAT